MEEFAKCVVGGERGAVETKFGNGSFVDFSFKKVRFGIGGWCQLIK